MKQTRIVEKKKVAPKSAILIEGLPGLGMVGKIATEYLVKQLRARRIAELYSPHFAYYVLVNKKGSVRLLRSVFHYWKNEKDGNELI
nr:proteasome assembly chaperone family protein [Nitrososphaeria archaeon]